MKRILRRITGIFSTLFGKKRVIRLGIYGEPNTGKTTLANKISMDWLGEPVGIVSEMPHETRMIQKKEHIEIKAGSKKLVMNLLDMPGLATQVDYRKFLQFPKKPGANDPVKLKDLRVSDLKKIAKDKDITVSGKKATIVNKLKKKVKDSEVPSLMDKLNIKKPKKTKKRKKYSKREAKQIAEEATKAIVEAIKWLDNVDTVLVMMDSTKDPLTQVNIMLIGNLEAKGIPVVLVANKIDKTESKPVAIANAFPQHPIVGISAKEGRNLNELYDCIARHSI